MEERNQGIENFKPSKIEKFDSVTKKVMLNKFLHNDIFGYEDALIPNSIHSYSVQCESEIGEIYTLDTEVQ